MEKLSLGRLLRLTFNVQPDKLIKIDFELFSRFHQFIFQSVQIQCLRNSQFIDYTKINSTKLHQIIFLLSQIKKSKTEQVLKKSENPYYKV